jgi:predicted glutamine amidotransferase
MCKFFVLWDNFSKYENLSDTIINIYYKYCNILSLGIILIFNNKYIVKKYLNPLECKNKNTILNINIKPKYLFYHMRLPYDKNKHSINKNNIHPFIFDDRYICMHNGLIKFKKNINNYLVTKMKKQIKGTTDSELFFAILLSINQHIDNINKSLKDINKFIKNNSLLNIVILDKKTNILYAYRGNHNYHDLPPLYLFKYGLSNIKYDDNYKLIPKNTLINRINNKIILYKNYINY